MLISIDTLSPTPIYEQLRDQIILGIASKQLAPGEELPSVRRLAADLGINFHTVNKAYALLADDGYLAIDRRKGTMVAPQVRESADFRTKLAQKILHAAAEASCHGISVEEFLQLCIGKYKEAEGKSSFLAPKEAERGFTPRVAAGLGAEPHFEGGKKQ